MQSVVPVLAQRGDVVMAAKSFAKSPPFVVIPHLFWRVWKLWPLPHNCGLQLLAHLTKNPTWFIIKGYPSAVDQWKLLRAEKDSTILKNTSTKIPGKSLLSMCCPLSVLIRHTINIVYCTYVTILQYYSYARIRKFDWWCCWSLLQLMALVC